MCIKLIPDTVYSLTGVILADMSQLYCRLDRWLRFTSGAFSTWLLVLLTVELLIVCNAPFFPKARLTPKTSRICSLITMLFIALTNMHLIIGFTPRMTTREIRNDSSCNGAHISCTYTTDDYERFYKGALPIIVLGFYTAIPAMILFIGNANIAVVLLLQRTRFRRVHPLNAGTGIQSSGIGTPVQQASINRTVEQTRISTGNHAKMEQSSNIGVPMQQANIKRTVKQPSNMSTQFTQVPCTFIAGLHSDQRNTSIANVLSNVQPDHDPNVTTNTTRGNQIATTILRTTNTSKSPTRLLFTLCGFFLSLKSEKINNELTMPSYINIGFLVISVSLM